MNQQERRVIAAVLGFVAIMVGVDLMSDSQEGVVGWHIVSEGVIALASIFGMFYVLRGRAELKNRLEKEIKEFSEFKKAAEVWRADSRKYVEGLAQAIDQQLTRWNLSTAEKEVAFLLLKGLSLKEIAEVRNTTEKTSRVQSMAIYSKSGLSGRSELSAYFLEDLLVPNTEEKRASDKLDATLKS